MKLTGILITGIVVLMNSIAFAENEYKTVKIGDSEVVFNYRPMEEGVATLTVTSLIYENNDTLRGIKNTDQRRLRKLGQLFYQCKLLLYKPDQSESVVSPKDPILISKNYSLITDVDLKLSDHERAGIQVKSLQVVDDESLFTPTLGPRDIEKEVQVYLGGDYPVNMNRLSLNILQETDLLKTAESVVINVRFPVFQMEQPAHEWSYSFNVKDFNQAIKYNDDNCTPARFMEFINING